MTNNIFENNLYSTAQERDELLKDKTKVMNALVINFLGFLSLYKLSDSRGVMKNYNAQEGKVRVQAITDTNNDVTVAIKLAFDARILPMNVVNQMTRLLALVKQRQLRGKDVDDARVRAILEGARLQSNRPNPRLLRVVEDFISGAISLDMVAGRIWQLTKLPELQECAIEFRDLYRKGQYAPLAKAAEEAHTAAGGATAAFIAAPTPAVVKPPVDAPVPAQAAPAVAPKAAPAPKATAPKQPTTKKTRSTKDLISQALKGFDKLDAKLAKEKPETKTLEILTKEEPHQPALDEADADKLVKDLVDYNESRPGWEEKFKAVVQNRLALEKYVDLVDSNDGNWLLFSRAMSVKDIILSNRDVVPFFEMYGSKPRNKLPPADYNNILFQQENANKNPEAVKAWFNAALKVDPTWLIQRMNGQDSHAYFTFNNNPVFVEIAHTLKNSGVLGKGDVLLDNLKGIIGRTATGTLQDWNQEALRVLIGDIETAKELYNFPEDYRSSGLHYNLEKIFPELTDGQEDSIISWFKDPNNDMVEFKPPYSYSDKTEKMNKYDFLVTQVMGAGDRKSNFPFPNFDFQGMEDKDITPEMKEILKEAFEKSTLESAVDLNSTFKSNFLSELYINKVRTQTMDPNTSVSDKIHLLNFVFDGKHSYEEFEDIAGKILRDPIIAAEIVKDGYIHELRNYVTLLNKQTKDGDTNPRAQVRTTTLILERLQSEDYTEDLDFVTWKLADFLVPLAIEGDIALVNDTIEKIENSNQKKIALKNIVESAVMSRSAEEINEGKPIKPITPIDTARVPQMLRFNNVSLPGFDIQEGDTYEIALKRAGKIQVELPELNVEEVELADTELEGLTAKIDQYRAGKHGDIGLSVKKVFNVNIKEQVDGTSKFKKLNPGTTIINPAFHGTGSQAACFILRYGFTVPPASDGSVVGRMLGDGIYIADTTDKAAQYITDSGYGRGLGSQGYLMEMEAVLGKKGEDFISAGVDDSNVISPEWCVKHGNKQLKIERAYLVELVKSDTLDEIRKKYNTMNESKIQSFSEVLTEAQNKTYGRVSFSFLRGNIPVDFGKYVDFTSFDASKFGDRVSLENGQNGPTVVFKTKDPNDFETFVFEFGDDLFVNTEVARKYMKLLNKG